MAKKANFSYDVCRKKPRGKNGLFSLKAEFRGGEMAFSGREKVTEGHLLNGGQLPMGFLWLLVIDHGN